MGADRGPGKLMDEDALDIGRRSENSRHGPRCCRRARDRPPLEAAQSREISGILRAVVRGSGAMMSNSWVPAAGRSSSQNLL